MKLRLYSYWRSSASWRVRIALAHKGIRYEYVPVHLDRGEQLEPAYGEHNPIHQVPALEWDDEGGHFTLAQSIAILEYLEERFPEPPLLPKAPVQRAIVRQIVETINSGMQPFQNRAPMAWLEAHGVSSQAWAREWLPRGLRALEILLRKHAGVYSVGDQVTVADVCLVPQLYWPRKFELALDSYPTVLRVEATCEKLEAFRMAHPDEQPDAPRNERGV